MRAVNSVAEGPGTPAPDGDSPPAPTRWWQRPRFWLAAMVIGFFAISLYSGIIAYTNLQTSNDTDAGIFTQAFASTVHGNVAPWFESYDCQVKSRCSFFLVHPGFVLYLAAPFYALAPSTVTLFAIRAVFVSTAAIPLYWLTRQVTGSPGKGLLAAGLFLVWAPSFVGDAFSLHLESLLPLELFTLAALWYAGRYRLGLAAAVVAFLTFEVYPLFTFLVGAFFLFPYVERPIMAQWRRWRSPTAEHRSIRTTASIGWRYLRETCRVREVRYTLVLMVSSVVAFVLLALFINLWGYEILGVLAPPVSPGIGGVFANPSSPGIQNFWTILGSSQTVTTAEYWLILYALVAFIPLLYPRALIISLPWIGWTFLTNSNRFTTLGHQYSLIAAAPIFIGLAFGLQRVHFGQGNVAAAGSTAASTAAGSAPRPVRAAWQLDRSSTGMAWVGVLAVVVAANGLLAPINPILPDLGVAAGGPFETTYFDHSLEMSSSYAPLESLVANIPYEATVGAPPELFTIVANHPHSYVMLGRMDVNLSNLPFNVSAGPQYVLVSSQLLNVISPNLSRNVSDPAVYGLRGYVGSSTVGTILLYERSYDSPAQLFGPALPPVSGVFTPGNGLTPGPKGVQGPNSSSPSGQEITSIDEINRSGNIWGGPDALLPPGSYTVGVELLLTGPNSSGDQNKDVLRITVSGFGGIPWNETLKVSSFPLGRWTNLTFSFSLADPLPRTDVLGTLVSSEYSVAVASVTIVPRAS
jgi:uncharacterized membrane protein